MKIAVLSGKGGTGKTFVSVNLAHIQDNAVYIDCDVEVPNGHLFLKPEQIHIEEVSVPIPQINHKLCGACRECMKFCKHSALAYAGGKVFLFEDLCHSCGGCMLTCPRKAIQEIAHPLGNIMTAVSGKTSVISGSLYPGEITGTPIIRCMMEQCHEASNVVIDCPPGSSCQVIHSVLESDFCIIVAEPTLFGIHDLYSVYELISLYNKPVGIVINKSTDIRNYIKTFCRKNKVKILAEIPFTTELAELNAQGRIACTEQAYQKIFQKILRNVESAYSLQKPLLEKGAHLV